MGTHFRGDPEQTRAIDCYIKLLRASETISGLTHRHLAHAGLSVSQFGVLECLFHLGPLCQRDIGRKILKSSGNITTVIDNLERRELVARQRSAEDRRFISIHLTDTGRELIAGLFPSHVERIVASLARLDAAEQDELARLCRKLGREG